MANWFEDKIKIYGTEEELENILEFVKDGKNEFSLNKIIEGDYRTDGYPFVSLDEYLYVSFLLGWKSALDVMIELSRIFPTVKIVLEENYEEDNGWEISTIESGKITDSYWFEDGERWE